MSYSGGARPSYGHRGYRDQRYDRNQQEAAFVHPSRQGTFSAEATKVDLTAPVIHFGTSRETAPRQAAKDHFVRAQDEKQHSLITVATKEQKMLTLYIGNISPDFDDYWCERLLKSAAKLRLWKRALDGTGQACPFGFAEFEDPFNVHRALKLLQTVKLPAQQKSKDEERALVVSQDEMSRMFVEDFMAAKGQQQNDNKERSILSSATGQIERVLKDFADPSFKRPAEQEPKARSSKKTATAEAKAEADEAAAVTILLSIEDELGDIPEELRDSIAEEITSFRERSAKRELERARQVADMEARRLEFERASRQEVPSARQRMQDVEEIALIRGPRKERGNHAEDHMSELEIAQSRAAARKRADDLRYIEEASRWCNKEMSRISALERQDAIRADEEARERAERDYQRERLAALDDTKEAHRAAEDFYKDRSTWRRNRAVVRKIEVEQDLKDKAEEERLFFEDSRNKPGRELDVAAPPNAAPSRKIQDDSATLRLSLAKREDADARRVQRATENLLEAEDEVTKRVLNPMQYTEAPPQGTEEAAVDRQARLRDIVNKIPTEKQDLWQYAVPWSRLESSMFEKLDGFLGKKLVEVLGMDEPDLRGAIMGRIQDHSGPKEIEEELVAAIGDEEESELTTIKIWRYLLILLETAQI